MTKKRNTSTSKATAKVTKAKAKKSLRIKDFKLQVRPPLRLLKRRQKKASLTR